MQQLNRRNIHLLKDGLKVRTSRKVGKIKDFKNGKFRVLFDEGGSCFFDLNGWKNPANLGIEILD